jgi:tetratricopeptide (TPR) repeat protein
MFACKERGFMMCIKIALLLLLLLCIGVPVFGADTVRTYDTVVHYDTTYLYDTTGAVQKQLNEIKSEFLDKALQSLEYSKSSLSLLLTIITVILAIIGGLFGYRLYSYSKVRDRMDNEIDKVAAARFEVSKILRDVTSKREQIMDMVDSVGDAARKAVAPMETEEAKEKRLSAEERIKLIEKADAEESIDEYEKLLFAMELEGVSKDKLPTSLHKNVGLNYYRLKRYEKAVEELLLYLAAFPNDEQSLFNVAYCFGKLKNYDKAVEFYSRLTQVDPTDQVAYYNWANNLVRLYDERKDASLLEEAIDRYKKAVEINDKYDNAYYNWGATLGRLYDERKDVSLLEKAIDKCKKAVQINNKNQKAWFSLSGTLLRKWRYTFEKTGKSDETLLKDARGHALKALEIAPEWKDRNYNLACAESLLENKPEMLKALKIAIEYDAEHKKMAREDKDFEKYWEDPDFIALTKED